jgi:outer membrane immunogenic protein
MWGVGMQKFGMVAAFASVIPFMAKAGDRFEGARVEVIGGYDRTDVAPGLGAENGVVYGLGAGYDFRFRSVVLGVEAEANNSSVERSAGAITRMVGRSFYAGARAGVIIADPLLVYIKGGYADGRFAGSGVTSYTGSGFRVGGGAELALTDRAFLKVEYRYSDYGREARGQTGIVGFGLRF